MKKITLLVSIFITFMCLGQEKVTKTLETKKHEIKFGAVKMLAGPIFEGTYEYINTKDFTFGSSILINLQNDNDYTEDFSVTPFARFYFQESKEYGANGFFVEGFAKYVTGRYEKNYIFNNNLDKQKFSCGVLGISLGKKWVNNSGFVFELLGGFGRTLGNSSVAPEGFFRGDFNIGYRF